MHDHHHPDMSHPRAVIPSEVKCNEESQGFFPLNSPLSLYFRHSTSSLAHSILNPLPSHVLDALRRESQRKREDIVSEDFRSHGSKVMKRSKALPGGRIYSA